MGDIPRGGNSLVREMNLSSVLGYLQKDAPLSRAQLAHLTGLTKSTVSSLVEELMSRGLVYETGIGSSGVGRPSTWLKLNPQAGCIIGVEIGVGFISVIVSNFIGEIIWRRYEELNLTTPQGDVLARTSRLIDEASEATRACGARLLGMGLAMPGMVDVERGVLVFSPNLRWRDVPLRQLFYEQTGLPVYVDNDANAAALSEHLFGVARRERHFVFIVAAVGVGGGLFLNGDLYRGAIGLAGEIGHTSVYAEQAKPCRCGNRGCWENSANQSALIERIRSRLEVGRHSMITSLLEDQNSGLTLSVISQAAEAGDAEALEALSETGAAIGLGVANLINIFNPEMIVIGGALSLAGKFLLPAIQKVVNERALDVIRSQTRVVLSAFGPDASVIGAVAMVVRAILSNPTGVSPIRKFPVSSGEEVMDPILKRIR